ncbi:hypothetical protein PV415_23170 [Streptomyces sp. ME03-5684b]|uniref:ApeA N-terminal domain 1-containing protein n=1 Tax=Streptomyces sp. ME03-5684b TaxID=3028681 RepID=UPI0029ADC048|nr:HEPN domain-containing protein [Streptomyces sp. ME03-5684b]MDX3319809.1 hypothetical protein [Streptomyces sp. ME03-5684b]
MDFNDVEASWWLPDTEHHRTSGTLAYSASGLTLTVYGNLQPVIPPELGVWTAVGHDLENIPIVYGETRTGQEISLLGVSGFPLRSLQATQESYRVELALEGGHVEETTFAGVKAGFHQLDDWAGAESIYTKTPGQNTVMVHPDTVELASAPLPEAHLRIKYGIEGHARNQEVSYSRWCAYSAEPAAPMEWRELLEQYVQPLNDLLVVAMGSPIPLNDVALKVKGFWCPAYFRTRETKGGAKIRRPSDYDSPALLTLPKSPAAAEQLLTSWFKIRAELRETLSVLLGPLYAPFTYEEHKFASFFQGLEAYHSVRRTRYGTTDVTKAEHKERVASVLATLSQANHEEGVIQWAQNILQTRNDKPLWRKVDDIVRSTETVGEDILGAAPNFCSDVARTRTGVSHGGAQKGLTIVSRYWHAEALLWIMRVRILLDIGITDAPERARQREAYQFMLTKLREESE